MFVRRADWLGVLRASIAGCRARMWLCDGRVITSSGIYGVIAGVKDKTFILKIADQVKIEVSKSAIAGLQGPDDTQ